MEDVKAKSGKEDGSKRSHRYKERNGDGHRSSREKRDRSERERSVHSDSLYEKEKDVSKRKERNRDRDKQHHRREMSIDSDSKYEKDKDRDKRKEKDRDTDKARRRRQREKSIESDSKYEKKRDKEKDRGKRKEKEIDIDKDDQLSEREKSIDSDSKYEKEKDREKRKDKDKKHRNKIREDGKERSRDKKRNRDEEVNEQDKDRDREKEREDKRSRTREKDKERDRDREREREKKEREREEKEKKDRERRSRGREKRRGYSSEDSEDESKDHDKKRRRREIDEYKEKAREQPVSSRSSKRKDDIDDDQSQPRKVVIDDKEDKESSRTREEELEDERKRLDDEMEKRRRRVQEWQELKRKKEESEREKLGETANNNEQPKSGKTWTLDGESDDEDGGGPILEKSDTEMDVDETSKQPDEETGDAMAVGPKDAAATSPQAQGGNGDMEEDEEIDPLDAFMNNMVLPEVEKLNSAMNIETTDKNNTDLSKKDTAEARRVNGERSKKSSNKSLGRIIQGEDSDSDYGDNDNDEKQSDDDEDDEEFIKRVKKTKAEKLSLVDHSKIDYKPFRKNFYIEVKEISRMTPEEVSTYRKQLELKIHGKDVPKPIKTWHQTGLTTKIMDTIKKLNYEKPMPIQSQALPVIMSGRDCIGIAKTGSGKTLAFVLPMLRHIKDQPPVEAGDGPIGLIMAPTRELVQQIHSDIRKFSKALGLGCVPVYGGSGVAQQISELKRGTEIVVCTPGRMIDILCTSGGKITNLRRVTYLVMDEADRMFDMGFEPQITRIVQNIRPDRQTVLFSATFPRQVEILARKVLNKPVELQVGGRSVVNKDIAQLVEVRPENDRILRLLELLGEWYEKGKILVFVQSQEKCDKLFQSMLNHGYPCLSLHGAKDQTDRESTISDFKNIEGFTKSPGLLSKPSSLTRSTSMAKLAIFFSLTLLLLPLLSRSFSPESPNDRRILVLLDDFSLKSSHSIYFASLKARGFDLDFKLADDPKLALQRYGQYLYDGLILFAPSVERFGGALDVAAVLDFVDSGHDLIIAADTSASDLIKNIATECGVDFDEEPSAMVIDHQSYAVSKIDGDHTLIAADEFIKSDVILGKTKIEAPVLFKGIAHSLNAANTLALKVLSASSSAYSANPNSKLSSPPSLTGSTISLVSVVQARNNARIMITGSLDMLSDRYMKSSVQKAGSPISYEKSGNEQFVTELSKWLFHERGHLKAGIIRHNKVGETGEPAMYRIKDDLEFYVEIYEWSGKSWEPYVASDVQVQFYMMSPYVLKNLSTDKKGLYHTSFKVPDVYGVFQFKVEYQKLGYTSLSLSKQIPVRPYRHNEYERFITTAFPYYGASFATMAGFFIFSVVYLYNK